MLQVRQEARHHFVSVNRELIEAISALLPARVAPPKRGRRRGAV